MILDGEDLKWRERANQTWLSNGDRNTAYFHEWANQRRKSNRITHIQYEEGSEWRSKNEVSGAFVKFFQNLYTTWGTEGIDTCLEGLE